MKALLKLFFTFCITIVFNKAFTQTYNNNYLLLSVDSLKSKCFEQIAKRDFNTLVLLADIGLAKSGNNINNQASLCYYKGYAYFEIKKYDSSIHFFKLSENNYTISKNIKGQADAMRRLHYAYYYAGQGNMRLPYIQKAISILDTTNNYLAKLELIAMLGEFYFDQGNYDTSIDYKLKFVETMLQKNNVKDEYFYNNLAVNYGQIAETYLTINQPLKAIEYLRLAKPNYRNFYHGIAMCNNNFITAFIKLQNIDSASYYYKNLYKQMKPKDTLFEILSNANFNFAEYYLQKKDTTLAIQYAINANQQSKEPVTAFQSQVFLGKILTQRGRFNNALSYLKTAEKSASNFGIQGYASVYNELAKTYAGLNKWELAYSYQIKYNQYNDSINIESSNKNIAQAEAKFQNKQKQQEIENKNLELKVQRNKLWWLIIGLIVSAIIAVLLFANIRNKKKTALLLNNKNSKLNELNQSLEQANQTKAKLFSIISHDLRSPISQVYQFLKLQQLNPQLLNETQKNELSTKIQTATGSLLETMEDLLLWSKTQMNTFTPNIQSINIVPILTQCIHLFELTVQAKNIIITKNYLANNTVKSDAYYLQIILRNLLQNAIKAAPQNSPITITIINLNNTTTVQIINQGNLFTQQQYQQIVTNKTTLDSINGLGLHLVDELSQKINASVYFTTTQNNETITNLTLV